MLAGWVPSASSAFGFCLCFCLYLCSSFLAGLSRAFGYGVFLGFCSCLGY